MATELNNFFVDKVKKLRAPSDAYIPKIDPIRRLEKWLDRRSQSIPVFEFKEITVQTLRKLIKKMKGGHSCGIDGIDSFSLKLAAPLIEESLLHLVNLSIRTATFPVSWKHQLIFPQHKKDEKFLVKNYRPVSHLNEIGLLTERAICYQIIEHFMINDLLHGNHHGGIPDHSTATALIQVYDMILSAAEERKLSALLLLDQTAAYDLLDHEILLKKLRLYSFDDNSISWISSYLSERSQSVQIESKLSPSLDLFDYGAPQGSLLGGLLFIINENDFPGCRLEGESVLYVDDDSDLVADEDPNILINKIQREADASCDWLRDNRMCVSGEKSKLLILGTEELKRARIGPQKFSIYVDGKNVEQTISEKLLGVIISSNLSWKEHIYGEKWRTGNVHPRGLLSALSKRVGILKKLSKYCSRSKLCLLAEGIFYSKLRYCLPLFTTTWDLDKQKDKNSRFTNFTKEDNRKLQVLQNQLCRLLLYKHNLYEKQNIPTRELLLQCNQLSKLGVHTTLMMIKKTLLSGKPKYIHNKLKKNDTRGTRSGAVLSDINAKLNVTRSSFIYRGIKLFNALPQKLQDESCMKTFKKELKKWVTTAIDVKPESAHSY